MLLPHSGEIPDIFKVSEYATNEIQSINRQSLMMMLALKYAVPHLVSELLFLNEELRSDASMVRTYSQKLLDGHDTYGQKCQECRHDRV